ncbi:MAG: hypothetical protein HZB80_01965 [Deltaproteobacteria bacterium]|nr:hypothetical protein [Deltaproteobacteria bacterium]
MFGAKTQTPVSLDKAQKIYERLISEKMSKGYVSNPGISGNVFGDASGLDESIPIVKGIKDHQISGVLPQILNECDDVEADYFINSSEWGAQEKYDGDRRLILFKNNIAQGINRKGFFVPLMPVVDAAVRQIGTSLLLDGEAVGETIYVFGLLEYNGIDLRGLSYIESYHKLQEVFATHKFTSGLKLVSLALTTEDKRNVFLQVKSQGGEGIVFKHLESCYSPGKPNTGGDQRKFKFWESASCVVVKINDKRSIGLGVYDLCGKLVNVGNVTIPPNHEIPNSGDVVEVRYLYAYKGGSLYQPIYMGKRTDLFAGDCVSTQLKYNGG